MTNPETFRTLLESRENLSRHIEELEKKLSERKAEIEALREENEALINEPAEYFKRVEKQAYEKGFNDCHRNVRNRLIDLSDWLSLDDDEVFIVSR